MKDNYFKLGDITIQVRGVSYKPADVRAAGDPNAVALLRANNIQEDGLNFDDLVWVDKQKVNAEQYLRKGDILVCSSSGSKGLVGKAAIVTSNLPYAFGTFCKVVRTENEYAAYLGQFFQSPRYREDISAAAAGANINNIRNEHIDKMYIYMPPNNERAERVQKLEQINCLIQKSNTQLKQLDELVKSRFVEMFIGKGYPTRAIDEVSLSKGEYGAQSASAEYDPTRPRYVRITDINDDGTLNDDVVASANPADDVQYKLEYGDFMFARMGATVGKTYVFIEGNQIFAGYLIRYRLNQELINPRYLFWYTRLEEYWNWVKMNQSGAAQPGINAKKYGSLQIPVPPLELQNQFAAFVTQVDKSKLAVKRSLEELETLKKSLMQQYFG